LDCKRCSIACAGSLYTCYNVHVAPQATAVMTITKQMIWMEATLVVMHYYYSLFLLVCTGSLYTCYNAHVVPQATAVMTVTKQMIWMESTLVVMH